MKHDLRAFLQRCADSGMTIAQTARELGSTVNAVSGSAKRYQIAFTSHWDVERRPEKYAACAKAGMTLRQAAAKLGVSEKTVSQAAQRYGLTFVTQFARKEKKWRDCWLAGMTAEEAALCMGVEHKSAHHAARRYGFRFKDAGSGRRVREMLKASRNHRDTLSLFWRKGRACAVPLTYEEFRNAAQLDARLAEDILGGHVREGLLVVDRSINVSIYELTDDGMSHVQNGGV
ncbi:hypothetical protein DL1_11860 [Thioclava dalianensis]|uniref:Uncharacterized protein n=1 Tax=Thioclava dalianensis TaxID=1185766 RepID=A0A074T9F1_9RHOB|nr:hypothetical protein [Thioclava dalianensis]KEP68431.1 hypothetical protein DL1_11860 [Thioclava dalianensis]SFN62228.1 hypothetical protein SAMN05216224_10836 [Thioclava dalianensis]